MAAPTSDIGKPDLSYGTWGQGLLTEWYETAPDLIWPQTIVTYGRMRNDPQIKAVLSAYWLPILRATWVIDGTGCKPEVTQHIADDLGLPIQGKDPSPGPARRRGVIWQRHLREALGYRTFGHMPFERRYEIVPDATMDSGQYTRLINLGARMPWTIAMMHVDEAGLLDRIEQTTQREPIPAERLVWYVNEQEGSNWAGISSLRAAFGAWLLKNEVWRVHATSIRRFGMGVPTVTAPSTGSQQQVIQAQQLASAMRAGDQSGMGLPAGFTASLMGMTGSAPDALAFIKYLDVAIAKMLLAGLIELGQTDNGSRALGETFMDLFQLSLQSVADEIATTATSGWPNMPGIVTDMVDQNWGPDEPAPRILCTDVGENYELSAAAIQSLTVSGAMTPDPALDAWVRKNWRLPERTDKWVPSSRGIPAGDSTKPQAEQALGYKGEPGAPGNATPGGGKGAPAPAAPTQQSQTPAAVAASTRKQQEYVDASTWEPTQHQNDWETALAHLLLSYQTVLSAQRLQLVDQVVDAMQAGSTSGLVLATPSVGAGPDLVMQAMVGVARKAAQAMVDEALRQGVHIDLSKVKLDAEALNPVASARAAVSASTLAQQATIKALQVYGPTPKGYITAADEVSRFIAGLSDQGLKDQLGAALTAAQNHGRIAVLQASPESAGKPVSYVAAEYLDKNTCENCRKVDGTPFDSLEAAEEAYPTGGYHDCLGLMRCRGTVVAVWGSEPVTPGRENFAPENLPVLTSTFKVDELRDAGGKWRIDGSVAHYQDNMGVDRAKMPQLSGKDTSGTYRASREMTPMFLDDLHKRGVRVQERRIAPGRLKPTQTTGDQEKIEGIADALKSGTMQDTKPIVVSRDNRVLDGHHNWAGRLLADKEGGRSGLAPGMPVHQVDLPMSELLKAADKFGVKHGLHKRAQGEFEMKAIRWPRSGQWVSAKFDPAEGRDWRGRWSKAGMLTQTIDHYTDAQGNWSPARQKLHKQIIDKALAGHKSQEHPIATIFGGGPASGKSALTGPDGDLKIDPDEIKGQLPEYKRMVSQGKTDVAAATVHEESSYLASRIAEEARKRKYHYTLDGTGDASLEKLTGKVEAARAAGYTVHAQYVTADTDEALRRAKARAAKTGRVVPETVLRGTHASVSRVLEGAMDRKLFDSVKLYDNNGKGAKLIATQGGGKTDILDGGAYRKFLAKGHEK